jgi:hypothetical protein
MNCGEEYLHALDSSVNLENDKGVPPYGGKNDVPIMGLRSHYYYLALVNYVIARHILRDFSATLEMTKSGEELFRMIIR